VHSAETDRSAQSRYWQECILKEEARVHSAGTERCGQADVGRSAYVRKRQECIVPVKARVHNR
jgi:hypothetical protein